MSFTRFPAPLLAVAVLCPACRPDAPEPPAYTIDTLPGGVVVVNNNSPSAWSDTNGWRLEFERTIAPPEDSPGALARPWSLAADSLGTLYVLDMRPAQIKVFRRDGTLSHLIGREGDGPAEYRGGATLHLVGDTLLVHDAGNSRVVRFHIDGTPLGGWPTPGSRLGATPTRADGAIPTHISIQDQARTDLDYLPGRAVLYFRTDGVSLDTVRIPPVAKSPIWELRDEHNDMGYYVPFAPDGAHLFTRSGRVVSGNQGVYQLTVSRTGTDTLRLIRAPAAALAIPDSIRRQAFDEAVEYAPWIAARGSLADIPDHYPPWLELAADGADGIWVQRATDTGFVADVFAADGILLGAVATPFEFHPRDHWTRDHIYHGSTDAEERPVIQVYRIVRSDP